MGADRVVLPEARGPRAAGTGGPRPTRHRGVPGVRLVAGPHAARTRRQGREPPADPSPEGRPPATPHPDLLRRPRGDPQIRRHAAGPVHVGHPVPGGPRRADRARGGGAGDRRQRRSVVRPGGGRRSGTPAPHPVDRGPSRPVGAASTPPAAAHRVHARCDLRAGAAAARSSGQDRAEHGAMRRSVPRPLRRKDRAGAVRRHPQRVRSRMPASSACAPTARIGRPAAR